MEIVITGASGLLEKNLIKYLCNFPLKFMDLEENSYDLKVQILLIPKLIGTNMMQ